MIYYTGTIRITCFQLACFPSDYHRADQPGSHTNDDVSHVHAGEEHDASAHKVVLTSPKTNWQRQPPPPQRQVKSDLSMSQTHCPNSYGKSRCWAQAISDEQFGGVDEGASGDENDDHQDRGVVPALDESYRDLVLGGYQNWARETWETWEGYQHVTWKEGSQHALD